jgi:hypothetical protein
MRFLEPYERTPSYILSKYGCASSFNCGEYSIRFALPSLGSQEDRWIAEYALLQLEWSLPFKCKLLMSWPGTTLTSAGCFAAYSFALIGQVWPTLLRTDEHGSPEENGFPFCESLRASVYDDLTRLRIQKWQKIVID